MKLDFNKLQTDFRDFDQNLNYRHEINELCEKDHESAEIIKSLCKEDIILFISLFCWTFDPRLASPHLPFILYPKQERLINKLDELLERSLTGEKVNLVLDKPRAVGATCVIMAWCLQKFLFSNFNARIGSRKEDYVDKKGEPDTLFYKFDYMLDRIPTWLKGGDLRRGSMMLNSLDTGNQISGESANPNFGRGGRKTVIVFDELGFWEWAKSSWESAGEATNFRIAMSTPPESGRDSYFYKLKDGKKGKVFLFSFDWRDVPGRGDSWLKNQRESKSEEEFAREVMKSYEGTTEGKVYAVDVKYARINDEAVYNPNLPLYICWDVGLDTTAMGWFQKDFRINRVYLVDTYAEKNQAIDFFIPLVTGEVKSGIHEYDHATLEKIAIHRNWHRSVTHFGDPDVKKRNMITKTSVFEELEKKGIYIHHKDWANRHWIDLRDTTKMLFRRLSINEKNCETFISAIKNARYPKRSENSQSTQVAQKPVHDWTSHYRSMLEYFADNEPEGDAIDGGEVVYEDKVQDDPYE